MNWRYSSIFSSLLLINTLAASSVYCQNGTNRSAEVVPNNMGNLVQSPASGFSSTARRYWADPLANTLLRSHQDGTVIETVLTGLKAPYGLGFDVDTQSFLWTSSDNEVVQKLAFGQSTVTTLPSSFEEPFAIEIANVGGNKEALSVLNNQVIRVVEDGTTGATTTEVLMTIDPTQTIYGLALDVNAGYLYIGNAVGMMTRKLRLSDRTPGQLIFTDPVPPVPDTEDEGDPVPAPNPNPCPSSVGEGNLLQLPSCPTSIPNLEESQ